MRVLIETKAALEMDIVQSLQNALRRKEPSHFLQFSTGQRSPEAGGCPTKQIQLIQPHTRATLFKVKPPTLSELCL